MSTTKVLGIMTLIAFVMGIFLVRDVVAGEKFKCRTVWYTTKAERINFGDEKDHKVGLFESKGIISNMEGKTFGDGWLARNVFIGEASTKPSRNSYMTLTDKDGDKIYMKAECKPPNPNGWTFFKGTGKFEGVQGKGIYSQVVTADPTLTYVNWEGEVELPK